MYSNVPTLGLGSHPQTTYRSLAIIPASWAVAWWIFGEGGGALTDPCTFGEQGAFSCRHLIKAALDMKHIFLEGDFLIAEGTIVNLWA